MCQGELRRNEMSAASAISNVRIMVSFVEKEEVLLQ